MGQSIRRFSFSGMTILMLPSQILCVTDWCHKLRCHQQMCHELMFDELMFHEMKNETYLTC